ncbi:LysR family transcriptional regulator [Pseudomonas sp. v388]|uniref:LysR substrate-binding domain-containing protein n=1 Tax=Pseudomonas sp. v388 TaxID=2479849 RepID=UPI000F7A481C|nr:LysR substrate-binding domain-containing protein [Pseudomonas sp. v388]RRV10427.1 LysR family transcriptional regulator [Pseudomonas sp. v388]
MSRFSQMQAFEAVAQAGSLAAAARHLNVSPATIMRTIASLEARLHCTLFARGPRGVSLSHAGEAFAQSCRYILEQTEVAERSAAGRHASPLGQLTVALPLLIDLQVFTPVTLAYLEAFPGVRLVIQASDGVPKLLKDGIDVAVVVGQLPSSSDFAMLLGMVKPMLCASPAYLAKWGRPATPAALKTHRAVVTTLPGYEPAWRFPSSCTLPAVKPTRVLTCTTQRAAIQAATLGAGLVRCLSYEVYDQVRCGTLEPVLTDYAGDALPANLIYRHGRRAEARVRTFIDFAAPLLRNHPAFLD